MPSPASPPEPIVVDAETVLRQWRLDDADAVVEACNDAETARWLPLPSPYTREDAFRYFELVRERWSAGEGLAFCLEHRGEAVGSIEICPRDKPASIGYWLGPKGRGKGLMTESVRALSAWAAEVLGVTEIWILTDPANVASRAVARRAGFVEQPGLQVGPDGAKHVVHRWTPIGTSHSPRDS